MAQNDSKITRAPLTDPATGKPLPAREQPGYYPGFSTLKQKKYWDGATREVVLDRVDRSAGPLGFFSAAEALTMEAVIARVLPQDDRVPERQIPILPQVDKRLRENRIEGYRYADMPPDQEAYRIAARAFEQMAQKLHGRSFHKLETLAQEQLVKSIHDGDPAEARDEWQKMNVQRFWSMLAGDVCSVYYAHPWAWDEIGFGGPAYPRGYMRLENGEPEPWEVREKPYAWTAPADTISGQDFRKSDTPDQTPQGQGGTH